MNYIIKRVPRIQAVNRYGIEYTGSKTWDYKHTRYLQDDTGKWTACKYDAKVFEGDMIEARMKASRVHYQHTNPHEHDYVGPVEVTLNADGSINHIEDKH